jgi:hypothetical protein
MTSDLIEEARAAMDGDHTVCTFSDLPRNVCSHCGADGTRDLRTRELMAALIAELEAARADVAFAREELRKSGAFGTDTVATLRAELAAARVVVERVRVDHRAIDTKSCGLCEAISAYDAAREGRAGK